MFDELKRAPGIGRGPARPALAPTAAGAGPLVEPSVVPQHPGDPGLRAWADGACQPPGTTESASGAGSGSAHCTSPASGSCAEHVSVEVRGTMSARNRAEREPRLRAAVAEAAHRVASARDRMRAALSGRAEDVDPVVLGALRSSLPVFQDHEPGSQEFQRMAQHVLNVLSRIHNGLTAQGVRFALVGEPGTFDFHARAAVAAQAYGWIDPPWLGVRHDQSRPEPPEIGRFDGAVNLLPGGLFAWGVIHEASHRFARTLDYQYSPHDVERGEDSVMGPLAEAVKDEPVQREAIARQRAVQLDRRRSRPAAVFVCDYWGRDQQAWYAMGDRALMNADSYAQLVMTLTQE